MRNPTNMMDSCSSGGSQYKVLGEETQCQKAGEWCFLDERAAHSIASLMKARNLKLREVIFRREANVTKESASVSFEGCKKPMRFCSSGVVGVYQQKRSPTTSCSLHTFLFVLPLFILCILCIYSSLHTLPVVLSTSLHLC